MKNESKTQLASLEGMIYHMNHMVGSCHAIIQGEQNEYV